MLEEHTIIIPANNNLYYCKDFYGISIEIEPSTYILDVTFAEDLFMTNLYLYTTYKKYI